MKNYIKVDSYRVVCSGSFWIAVFGVFFVNLLGRMQQTFSLDVFTAQYYSNMYSLFILSFAFGSLAYANSLVEDAECKSWYLQIQRGSLKGYVRSKVLICFFSAVLATMMGTMLFVLVGRAEMPFLSEENFFYDSFATQSMFAGFLTPERILLYFIVIAFMQGILAGILAMCSMLLSLFVRNRMFTITVPVIGFYFLTTYLEKISPYLDLYNMYVYGAPVLGNNAGSFLYALVLAVILLILFDELIQLKMEREMKR